MEVGEVVEAGCLSGGGRGLGEGLSPSYVLGGDRDNGCGSAGRLPIGNQ